MRIGTLRVVLVAVTAVLLAAHQMVQLSAQLPESSDGPGWLVAYGGGGSLTGALGVTAPVVSPPVALRLAGTAFDDIADASTSSWHTLVVRRDGRVWSVGSNDRGQLGLGFSGDPIDTLTQVPGLFNIVKVVASGSSSYAIDTTGALWVWGDDSAGQLGIGQPGGALEQTSPTINPVSRVTDVDGGTDFAIAADGDGAIWAWGANADSQLGAAGPDRNLPGLVTAPPGFFAVDVAAGGATSLARARSGDVMGWGSNGWHQIADAGGTIEAGTTIVATDATSMSAGDGHIIVLRTNGEVQARGANWAGQLGIGTQMPTAGLVTVAGLSGVVDVAVGAAHTVAVTADGLAYAWGFNHKRQLLLPTPDVFIATPQRVLDLPPTARFARAKSDSSLLLSDPGALAVHVVAPPVVECATPFDANVSIAGFDASGGEPDQYFPGIQDLEMTLDLAPSFELASPATVSRGTVTAIGRTITWSMASFDASTATLSLRVRASGGASADGLFESISYVSSFESAPTLVQSPITSHPACEMADVTPPAITSVAANPATLFPPNQQMVPVAIAVEATDNESAPACAITGVTSNEPIQGDWVLTGPLTLSLRAEREGQGTGRSYRVAVRCVDAAGNSVAGIATVLVPKGKQHPPHAGAKPKPRPKPRHGKDRPRKK